MSPLWPSVPSAGRRYAGRFSVWHHLDANGIRFKSITRKRRPADQIRLQRPRRRGKEVLGRALPHGYIIALVDEENSATAGYPACAMLRAVLDNASKFRIFSYGLVMSRFRVYY